MPNKSIVITGATKGIGRATAFRFAEEQFDLALTARTKADLDALEKELADRFPGITVCTHPADIGIKEQVQVFAGVVQEQFDHVDVLMNNAGLFIPGMIHEEEEGVLDEMINAHVYGTYHLTRALVGDMIERQQGHLINICSTASIQAYPNGGSYCIAKHAQYGLTKVLREEMKEHGVKVTAVIPGPTYTASWEGADIPEERFMPPEDVAEAIWNAYHTSDRTNVEEIRLRPSLGDL